MVLYESSMTKSLPLDLLKLITISKTFLYRLLFCCNAAQQLLQEEAWARSWGKTNTCTVSYGWAGMGEGAPGTWAGIVWESCLSLVSTMKSYECPQSSNAKWWNTLTILFCFSNTLYAMNSGLLLSSFFPITHICLSQTAVLVSHIQTPTSHPVTVSSSYALNLPDWPCVPPQCNSPSRQNPDKLLSSYPSSFRSPDSSS